MKSKPGDRIRDQGGRYGVIVRIPKTRGIDQYVVRWDLCGTREYSHFSYYNGDLGWQLMSVAVQSHTGDVSASGSHSTTTAKHQDIDFIHVNINIPGIAMCTHSWKLYHGLRESFEYCEKCNEKKDVNV
jgi:hypothetical protein